MPVLCSLATATQALIALAVAIVVSAVETGNAQRLRTQAPHCRTVHTSQLRAASTVLEVNANHSCHMSTTHETQQHQAQHKEKHCS